MIAGALDVVDKVLLSRRGGPGGGVSRYMSSCGVSMNRGRKCSFFRRMREGDRARDRLRLEPLRATSVWRRPGCPINIPQGGHFSSTWADLSGPATNGKRETWRAHTVTLKAHTSHTLHTLSKDGMVTQAPRRLPVLPHPSIINRAKGRQRGRKA